MLSDGGFNTPKAGKLIKKRGLFSSSNRANLTFLQAGDLDRFSQARLSRVNFSKTLLVLSMSRSERVWGTWKSVCPCVIYLKIRTLWVWEVVFKEYEKCFVLEMEMFKTRE